VHLFEPCAIPSGRAPLVLDHLVRLNYGKDGDLTGPDKETQEISMLALHLLQSALVLVNTRLVDRVLSEPEWAARLTERDVRGLTPLFWSNVLLHGVFAIDLDKRLDYDRTPSAEDAPSDGHLDDTEDIATADDHRISA